jgi:hypothetical protein
MAPFLGPQPNLAQKPNSFVIKTIKIKNKGSNIRFTLKIQPKNSPSAIAKVNPIRLSSSHSNYTLHYFPGNFQKKPRSGQKNEKNNQNTRQNLYLSAISARAGQDFVGAG